MDATELRSADTLATPRAVGNDQKHCRLIGLGSKASFPPCGPLQTVLTAMPLVAADLLAVLGSFTVAWRLATTLWPSATLEWAPLGAGFVSAIFMANLAVGLYPGIGISSIAEVRQANTATAMMGLIFLIVSCLEHRVTLPIQVVIAATCGLLLFSLPINRTLARAVFSRCGWWGEPALIVGTEPAASTYSFLCRNPRLGLRPVGIIGDWPAVGQGAAPPFLLGPLSRAGTLLSEFGTPWLIVAMPERPQEEIRTIVHRLGRHAAHRTVISDLNGSPGLWNRASECLDWPGTTEGAFARPVGRLAKRAIDVVLTVAGGALLLPLMILIAVLIRLYSAGPALYCQQRIGRHGRRFMAWKFRTMVCDADRVLGEHLAACPAQKEEWDRTHKLQRDPRVTPIGRLLRKSSLDELPQLWNVLRGEMSLVGPRPIVAAEIAKYANSFEPYCRVLPGITGLWQVSGRNDTTYAERVELDSYYVRNWSLWLDLYILLLTVKVVIFRQGAY
jgi:Undecaprenyl-phosphate galactose phosphotransferase WbaP